MSFEVGMAPFTGNTPQALLIFTIAYFALVMVLSLFPGKLMDNIGKIITPALIVVLAILGDCSLCSPRRRDRGHARSGICLGRQGAGPRLFRQGYQTMDALASLVFGIIIVAAIKAAGVTTPACTPATPSMPA